MKPCCLKAEPVASQGACEVEHRIVGSMAYHIGGCPATAEEAAELIFQTRESPHRAGSNTSTSLDVQAQTDGCCFSIGYGSFMKACCLTTEPVANQNACNVEYRKGGGSGSNESGRAPCFS